MLGQTATGKREKLTAAYNAKQNETTGIVKIDPDLKDDFDKVMSGRYPQITGKRLKEVTGMPLPNIQKIYITGQGRESQVRNIESAVKVLARGLE